MFDYWYVCHFAWSNNDILIYCNRTINFHINFTRGLLLDMQSGCVQHGEHQTGIIHQQQG